MVRELCAMSKSLVSVRNDCTGMGCDYLPLLFSRPGSETRIDIHMP